MIVLHPCRAYHSELTYIFAIDRVSRRNQAVFLQILIRMLFADGDRMGELLDGYDFAARVVQDLQDDIEYFRLLIQSLTREALEQKVAWSEFNEFIWQL